MEKSTNTLSKFIQEIRGPRRGRYFLLGGVLTTILGCVSTILIGVLSPSPEQGETGSVLPGFFLLITLSMLCGGVVIAIIGGIISLLQNRKANNLTTEMGLSISASPDLNPVKIENSVVQLPPLQPSSSESEFQSVEPLPVQPSLSQPSPQIPKYTH